MNVRSSIASRSRAAEKGSILVIVMWIAFGLVSISLYLGNSMGLELRAADNRAASTSVTTAASALPCRAASASSAAQKAGSRLIEVWCPAMVIDRLSGG